MSQPDPAPPGADAPPCAETPPNPPVTLPDTMALRFSSDGHGRLVDSPERKQWTDATEAVFLEALAGSGNIGWSAKQAGISSSTVWYQKRHKPAFAQACAAALDHAFTMLEFELVTAARASLSKIKFPPQLKIAKMSAGDAIRVLSVYKASLARNGRRGGTVPLPASIDEVHDELVRRITVIVDARKKR